MTFQIFLPDLALVCEYNGIGHYQSVSMYGDIFWFITCRFDKLEVVQQRDKAKQMICDAEGYTLVVIPYWWDKKLDSIVQTIHLARPDIHQAAQSQITHGA